LPSPQKGTVRQLTDPPTVKSPAAIGAGCQASSRKAFVTGQGIMASALQERKMARMVAEMTGEELCDLVGAAVERKIVELLGDPDAGLVLRENVRKRLLRQRQAVAKGERGQSLETVIRRLKLA
jgi:hypothetical protein